MKKRQLTVLIADNAPEGLADMRDAFSLDPTTRYVALEAESAYRALELCRQRSPDCLILSHSLLNSSGQDWSGLDLSSLDTLKRFCVEDGSPPCAIVVLVSAGDTQFAVEAMMSGASFCIEKDRAKGMELLRAVDRAIEMAERRQGGEERLRLLNAAIEQSDESVIITTAQLDRPGPQIVYVNSAFTRMTGYAPEEVMGKTPRVLQGPRTDRSALSQLRMDCEAGKVFHGEVINYRKDGSEFCNEWSVGPVRDKRGKVTHFVATQRDVTARRRVEQGLRRSEEEFRTLFDLSAIGMAQVSPEGRYLRVNRKLCQMLGYSEQELLNLTLHEVTHPEDRELSAEKLSSSFAGEPEEYSIEKRYLRKDGQLIWVLINWTVVRDAEGRSLRTVANIQDITARKRAEEALRANEAQLRAILDHSAAVVSVKDLEGRFLRVNRWYEVMHGWSGAEVKGKTDYDLHAREIADVVRANDREVIAAGAPLQFEEQIAFPDGPHHFISVKFPLRDNSGRPYAVCGIATDITERKRAEEALKLSEERLDLALQAGDIGTFDWDIRGNAIVWTEKMRAMYGMSSDKVVSPYERWRHRVHPEDLPRAEADIQEIFENKLDHWQAQFRIIRADTGEVRWIESMCRIFYDVNGAPLRMIGTNLDITDHKQAEAEREELLAREQAARATAEQANRMKDEFLALVSHELRSPLNAILGYAALLRHSGTDARQIRHAADVIERNGKAQTQLIDDLLDTARIISGKLRLDVGPVDPVAVIAESVQTIRPAAEAKGVSLQATLAPEIGQITGDRARLLQVVWNLLSNAVKFTPEGGRVEIRLERVDPHICVTVSDTGKGINPDFLPFVFERFRQADASSSRRHGGLGLGLALVKYLVELHGGTVEAQSAGEGQGSTFNVVLPVRAVATPTGEAVSAPELVNGSGELAGVRALVVDDEDDARELLKSVFMRYGADVVAVGSAAEAYAQITETAPQERFDVMVTDVGMPGEDGYSLMRRVREWERGRGAYLPAVALTAYGRTEDRLRALRAGFQMHVAKPADPAELAIVITSLIRRPNSHGKT
jgi:PAS domain S-box-containing protein